MILFIFYLRKQYFVCWKVISNVLSRLDIDDLKIQEEEEEEEEEEALKLLLPESKHSSIRFPVHIALIINELTKL
jgi:hypothetical protein